MGRRRICCPPWRWASTISSAPASIAANMSSLPSASATSTPAWAWVGAGAPAHGLLRNPIALVFPFLRQPSILFWPGRRRDFKAFFHGHNVGVFGGAVWHTPLDGLSLMVEYDSDTYAQEKALGNFPPRSQVNYGLTYDLSDQTRARPVLALWHQPRRQLLAAAGSGASPISAKDRAAAAAGGGAQRRTAAAGAGRAAGTARSAAMRARRRLFESRNADRNDFVDALWRQGGDYADIQVRQSMLDLTVTGRDFQHALRRDRPADAGRGGRISHACGCMTLDATAQRRLRRAAHGRRRRWSAPHS